MRTYLTIAVAIVCSLSAVPAFALTATAADTSTQPAVIVSTGALLLGIGPGVMTTTSADSGSDSPTYNVGGWGETQPHDD